MIPIATAHLPSQHISQSHTTIIGGTLPKHISTKIKIKINKQTNKKVIDIREIYNRVYGKRQTWDSRLCFLEKISTEMRIVQNNSVLWWQRKTTQFTEKLKTARGTWRINMVTWSFLPFSGVNVILINLSVVTARRSSPFWKYWIRNLDPVVRQPINVYPRRLKVNQGFHFALQNA